MLELLQSSASEESELTPSPKMKPLISDRSQQRREKEVDKRCLQQPEKHFDKQILSRLVFGRACFVPEANFWPCQTFRSRPKSRQMADFCLCSTSRSRSQVGQVGRVRVNPAQTSLNQH
ncbi:hypothetical protein POM88_004824 [Heracleum sosnowskyi]|uniref:Uncharacterized protein n=1 Tax=Heracleum sosnowskyi TaxID=360622 RepID=A0AAD8JJ40_9APIA|nr:hypothetical protein POM88_004824 [Heracleum sosnowskyi]